MMIKNTTKDYGKQSAKQNAKYWQFTLDYKILPPYFYRKFLPSLFILSLLFITSCGKTGKLYLPDPQNEASQTERSKNESQKH